MTVRFTRALSAASLGLVLAFAAGCSGDPCDDVSCPTGEECNAEGRCVSTGPDLCADKTCPAGTGCNPDSGNCMNLCSLPGAATCTLPETCDPATGTCVDKCAGVSCDSDTLACNGQTGQCEPKCKPTTCNSEQTCVPTTGACIDRCEDEFTPNGKPRCAEGLKCKGTTGECVPLCDGVTCDEYAQWCENATGDCTSGQPAEGRPGSACEEDTDCGVDGAPSGQEFTCRKGFPEFDLEVIDGGYCTASCSATTPCPDGSIRLGDLGCLDTCMKDSECRAPWRCTPIGSNQAVCLPSTECTQENPENCSSVGGDCRDDGDCIDGAFCISEQSEARDPQTGTGTGEYEFSGFEDGYCLWGLRNTDTCPDGSTQAIRLSQNDPSYMGCLKDCQTGDVGGCNLGESCYGMSETTNDGVCFNAQCTGDRDCKYAPCSATDTEYCGRGQACEDGECRMADSCDAQNPCAQGLTCTDGVCTEAFCEPGLAVCLYDFDCRQQPEASRCGGTSMGLSCNTDTGRCERRCSLPEHCGANAVCVAEPGAMTGVCQARCTLNNEEALCGEGLVCNETSGQCEAPCSETNACEGGQVCDAGGHCLARCDAAQNPAICLPNQVCGDDGLCVRKCTASNEVALCTPQNKVCQRSTGKCLPSCVENPEICGDEACSVVTAGGGVQVGYCGRTCTGDSNCGPAPTGEALTCQGAEGAKVCDFKACTTENAATVCAEDEACNEGQCRKVVIE